MKCIALSLALLAVPFMLCAQKSDKLPRVLGEAIALDTSATVMIPTRYNAELLSSNKIALWNDFYANVIFYDMQTDKHRKLFESDTFIRPFTRERTLYNRYENEKPGLQNMSRQWVFYFVKANDYNNSGRIDSDDPAVLYVSDKTGHQLKALTPENENAVSMEIYEKQGYALVKMQRDSDKNKRFEAKDKDHYYIRLDLNSLTFGNKIEIN
jgi:hypothetical protein